MSWCSIKMTGRSALIWKAVDIVAPSETRLISFFFFFNILKKYATTGKLARIEFTLHKALNFRQLQVHSYKMISFWEFTLPVTDKIPYGLSMLFSQINIQSVRMVLID